MTIPKAFCTRLSWCEANLQPSLIDNDRSLCKPDREAEGEPGSELVKCPLASGHERASPGPSRQVSYCLSYIATFVTFLPWASVAVVVTVRDLPSFETTMRPVSVVLPPFLPVSSNVFLSIIR